jgi:hypothetical protein
VDLSAFRIIQEALTNVVKHAGTGAACLVSVTYTHVELVILVTDDGRGSAGPHPARTALAASGTGHGIIGMRERVHLCDGTFSAGPRPEGGFEVTAALPLPGSDPALLDPALLDPTVLDPTVLDQTAPDPAVAALLTALAAPYAPTLAAPTLATPTLATPTLAAPTLAAYPVVTPE